MDTKIKISRSEIESQVQKIIESMKNIPESQKNMTTKDATIIQGNLLTKRLTLLESKYSKLLLFFSIFSIIIIGILSGIVLGSFK